MSDTIRRTMRARAVWVVAVTCGALVLGCELIAGLQDRSLETCDACVDALAPDVNLTCKSPRATCSPDACVDLSTDPNHCGTCAKACTVPDAGAFDATTGNPDPGIASFDAGDARYVSVPGPTCDGGACGLACSGSSALCSDGLCYDTASVHDHCGACTTACPASQWCHGGHCCDAGTESCDGGCIDVVSDNANCGACGVTCGGSTPNCVNGTCIAGVVFTDSFTTGLTPSAQCVDWNAFRAKLTGTYTTITVRGSNDPVGHTCTGATANTLCQALRMSTITGSLSCDGYTWGVSTSCGGVELNAKTGMMCMCETPGYDLRPCEGSYQYGGVNTATCSPPTQTMTVICQ